MREPLKMSTNEHMVINIQIIVYSSYKIQGGCNT